MNTILPGSSTPADERPRRRREDALAASVRSPAAVNPMNAKLALCMIETGYFNGEDVRLDGAIRMAPR